MLNSHLPLARVSPLSVLRSAVSRLGSRIAGWVIPGLRTCFDPSYYRDRYPDVARTRIDPLAHFLLYGGREKRQPNPWFDSRYYLGANPDVARAGSNPLLHFLRYGWKEGRRPNPLFDATFYIGEYPGVPPGRNPFVDYVRRRRKGEKVRPGPRFRLPSASYQVATKPQSDRPVDVLIPVYSGLEETRTCIESLLNARCQIPHQIVLINDQSPDPELTLYLRRIAAGHHLTLLENEANLGFAASVNRGFALHPDRDVVLLNNDTGVAQDWLDRLAAAARSGERTGTATPFSNHATLCSYPKPDTSNPIPGGLTIPELDAIFRRVNSGHRVPLPTGVGFCMYIRRDCLDDTGPFRPEIFGRGYGEENDFCLRALYKGWNHVLAADVFVYHAGETSFASEAEPRRAAALQTLFRLHPQYKAKLAAHTRADPAKPYRMGVSADRMKRSGKPVLLAVSHDLGGGVAQYVREFRESVAGKVEVLLLTPTDSGAVMLRNLDPADDFAVAFDLDLDYRDFLDLLRACGVNRVHVHHLSGHTLDVPRLCRDLGVPLDFTAHDYFVVCPQVTLSDAGGRYCGEPDADGCNACLALRPPSPRLSIEAWRQKYSSVVAGAERVIAPSGDTARRFRRYFPAANIMECPHPGPASTPVPALRKNEPNPLVIAVLGAMTVHKGVHRLRECATLAVRQNLPLRFYLAGSVDPAIAAPHEPFVQTGPYINDQLPQLLRESAAHLVWFPAQWPETFSYTLSACFEMGLPVVVPDLGAFPERVAGRPWSWVVPWDWEPPRLIEFFLSIRPQFE